MTSAFGILSVNEDGLDHVIQTLQLLKEQNGVEAVADLWLGENGTDNIYKEIRSWSKSDITSSISSYLNLRPSLKVLSELTTSLSSLVALLESKSRAAAFHLGLAALPCELLAYIIELACVPYSSNHVRLASVNRQFRQIVLSHPKLWSYISTQHSLGLTELQLKRSAPGGLSIKIAPRERGTSDDHSCSVMMYLACSCVDALATLKEHADRWREVTLVDTHESVSDSKISRLLSNTTFPALVRVSLGAGCIRGGVYEVAPLTWTAPALQSLTCPPEGVRIRNFPLLRSFHANFLWVNRRETNVLSSRIYALMKTLSHSSMSILSSLEFTFPTTIQYGPATTTHSTIQLPNLRTLKLGRCIYPRLADYVINHILSRLDIPSLADLEFRLDNQWRGDEDLLLLHWFEGRGFEHLERVHVEISEDVKPVDIPAPIMDFHERVRQAFLVPSSSSSRIRRPPYITTEAVSNESFRYRRPYSCSWYHNPWVGFEPEVPDQVMGDEEEMDEAQSDFDDI